MIKCRVCGKSGLFWRVDRDREICKSCWRKELATIEDLRLGGRKIAYFQDGTMVNLYPRNEQLSLAEDWQNRCDSDYVFISDGDIFDSENKATIENLKIPAFSRHMRINSPVTLDLSYVIKLQCRLVSTPEAVPSFVKKTLELMEASLVAWRRGDYLQVIRSYYRNGLFEAGDLFEAQYRQTSYMLFSHPHDEIYEGDHLTTKYYFEDKWRRYQEYSRLKIIAPELLPDTPTGYSQIRTRQTKRYIAICEIAKQKGIELEPLTPYHFCRKYNMRVEIDKKYGTDVRKRLLYCECSYHKQGKCDGKNEFGLYCVYPREQ